MTPSILNGFYNRHCPFPPLHPHLHRGLVASYCPLMGRQGNTLFDWSGYNNHGTLTNMDAATDYVPASVKGAGGYALDFDGSNDHVFLGSTAPNAFPTGSSPRTVAAWVNTTGATGYRAIVGWGGLVNDGEFTFCLNGLRPAFDFWFAADTAGESITANNWHHLGATWDGSTLRYWIDGKNNPSDDATPTINTNSNYAKIGQRPAQNNYHFSGKIAQAVVYNRVLTAAEFRTLYADPLALYRYQLPTYAKSPGGGFNAAWARRRTQIIGGGCL